MKTQARQKCDDYYFLDYFFQQQRANRKPVNPVKSEVISSGVIVVPRMQDESEVQTLAKLQLQTARMFRQIQELQTQLVATQATIKQWVERERTPTVKVDGAKETKVDHGKTGWISDDKHELLYCKCRMRHTDDCNCPIGRFK